MEWIRIRGARQHNLRGVDVDIPRGRLVVVTGPSGSGKSSLAFHTLYAEGQRRYVESLSAYARQFIDQLDRPDVESIEGLSPAIAIDQRPGSLNPRSTVATATEIHDYLRVLWAAAGTPHDPATGERLVRMTAADIVAALGGRAEGTKVVLLAPLEPADWAEPARLLGDLRRQGFVRVRADGEILDLDEAAERWPARPRRVEVVVDRVVVRPGVESRLADSVETALRIRGVQALALVQAPGADEWDEVSFQTSFRNPATGFQLGALTPRHFSFNSHLGACPACEGLGSESFCDPELLVADRAAPLVDGGIRGWWTPTSRRLGRFRKETAALLAGAGLAPDASFDELSEHLREVLLHGGEVATGWKVGPEKRPQTIRLEGLCAEAGRTLLETSSESVRRRLARVMGRRACGACGGRRLKPEVLAVRIEGSGGCWLGIHDFCGLPVEEAADWLAGVRLPVDREEVCRRVVAAVQARLGFLQQIGLGYLALDRTSGTLSGGEAQRIRLATQLGGGLAGVLYVLDEPSVGLHPVDTGRLIEALATLRDGGNTVVVVEHDEAIIRAADWMIELGPGAGRAGGEVLAAGPLAEVLESDASPTGRWLGRGGGDGRRDAGRTADGPTSPAASPGEPGTPSPRWGAGCSPDGLGRDAPATGRAGLTRLELATAPRLVVRGAREHNLRGIDAAIPLGAVVCVTGPSGSGKSTLVDDVLGRVLARHFHGAGEVPGAHDGVDGLAALGKFVCVDQSPIGRSPRSNPATFSGAFDVIRELFAGLPLARQRGYGSGRFSFNTRGGRCEKCEGAGRLRIELNFLPDAWVTCDACGGRRFNRETLEVTFKGRSIAEVLAMTVEEAAVLFRAVPKLERVLAPLRELGLGYLELGQAATTLSGGEAQRLKLALELARPAAPHTLYLFDEPTTGLHFGDVGRLLDAFARLRAAGHSVLVVEHHLDVIAAADWVIDLGPGGGRHGGCLVAEGPPAAIARCAESATGRALRAHLERHAAFFQTDPDRPAAS